MTLGERRALRWKRKAFRAAERLLIARFHDLEISYPQSHLHDPFGAVPAFLISGDTAPERLRKANEYTQHAEQLPGNGRAGAKTSVASCFWRPAGSESKRVVTTTVHMQVGLAGKGCDNMISKFLWVGCHTRILDNLETGRL